MAKQYDTGRRKKSRRYLRMRRAQVLVGMALTAAGLLYIAGTAVSVLLPRPRTLPESGISQSVTAGRELPEDADIPESLLLLYERNAETEEFVLGYPKEAGAEPEIDVSGELGDGGMPFFLQWDKRWGYRMYGNDFMALTGCGPTCLSMVYTGLTGDARMNPYEVAQLAEKEGYYVEGSGSSWSMMERLAAEIGLNVEKVTFDEEHILSYLKEGNPIICVVGPGDFTTTGHFIVLCGVTADGKIEIRDPNSRMNTEKSWELQTLMRQIRNLWGYCG